MPSITIATTNYVLSIDTDYCFVLITKGNTWRRTTDPAMVRALATVIPRMVPGDEKYAAQLWNDLSPMAEHEHKPTPVQNRSSAHVSYPPTGGSASTRPRQEPVGKSNLPSWPEPLKAHSFETKYRSRDFYVQ